MSDAARAERLVSLAAGDDLDLLLVGDLVRPGDSGREAISNLRWLTGFSGKRDSATPGSGRLPVIACDG